MRRPPPPPLHPFPPSPSATPCRDGIDDADGIHDTRGSDHAHDAILAAYDTHRAALLQRANELRDGLSRQLAQACVVVHSLSVRVKDRGSLRNKISRPDKTYHALTQVTDLIGLRVVTYFEDEIDQVAALIEESFAVDFHHSHDKLQAGDHRNFGYRSMHYICRDDAHPDLPEGFRFEIQIRTILQHAWAEVEHDLGYKASDSTPASIRRRFSRIAGLLEIADEEFVSIRRDLRAYEISLRDALSDPAGSFPLDRISLRLIAATPEVTSLDMEIAAVLGRELGAELFYPEYLLKMLKLAGYRSTRELRQAVGEHRGLVRSLIGPYFEFTGATWKLTAHDLDSVRPGYSLFFLSHAAILRSPILEQNKVTKVAELYRELDYPDDEATAFEVAGGLLAAFRRAGIH